MKYLKSYKIFESISLELETQIKEYDIKDYSINEDGSIDCNQDVNLSYKHLIEIPILFNKISGKFLIFSNQLSSLKNCPVQIDDYFDCSSNQLKTLEFGPEYVGREYQCYDNKLITLNGCVEEVYGDFDCSDNNLTSLEFCPMQVEGYFNCSDNNLTELDRSPFVRENLVCKRNKFKSEPIFSGHCKELIWE